MNKLQTNSRNMFQLAVDKVISALVGLFGMTVVAIIDFLSGKPDSLSYVINKIDEHLKSKVLYISRGTDLKDDGNTYFVIDQKPNEELSSVLVTCLNLTPRNFSIISWKKKEVAIKINKVGMEEITEHIRQTHPNIVEKLLGRKITNFSNKLNLLSLYVYALVAILARGRISNEDIKIVYSICIVISSAVGKYGTATTQNKRTDWTNSEYSGLRYLAYHAMFLFGLGGLVGLW